MLAISTAARAVAARDPHAPGLVGALLASRGDAAVDRLQAAFGRALRARLDGSGLDAGNLYELGAGPDEMLAAYDVLARRTPFIRFGWAAANRAILAALGGRRRLHVVDVGVGWGGQWIELLDRVAAAGPATSVRLTGIEIPTPGDDPETQLRQVGARLGGHAARVGVPFVFTGVASPIQAVDAITCEPDEVLVVNAAFALHHVPDADGVEATSRDAVLRRLWSWGPAALVLVEPDADHAAPPFEPRVEAAVRHYGAVFDALAATCADEPRARRVIEAAFFGREILNVVAAEGPARVERHEPLAGWVTRRERLGATPTDPDPGPLASELELAAGFAIHARDGALTLSWRGTPVVNAMAWKRG